AVRLPQPLPRLRHRDQAGPGPDPGPAAPVRVRRPPARPRGTRHPRRGVRTVSGTGGYPDFPGSVGLSHLSAYPWPTAEDEHGGSPHMPLACAECYVVGGGRGRLETLSREGVREFALSPGDVVWFTPGTIHRAVNDGDLRVVVVMQNG